MASLDELKAKAALKSAKRNSKLKSDDEKIEVPRRPWLANIDLNPEKEIALKSPALNADPTPPQVDSESLFRDVLKATKEISNTEKVNSKEDVAVIAEVLPSNYRAIAEQFPTDPQPIPDLSPTHRGPIGESSPTSQGAVSDLSESGRRVIGDRSPISRRPVRERSESGLRSVAAKLPSELPSGSGVKFQNNIPPGIRLMECIGPKQAIVLQIIYRSCVSTKSLFSSPIAGRMLIDAANSSQDGMDKLIITMKKRGLIKTSQARTGPGGFRVFELHDWVYEKLSKEGDEIAEVLPSNYRANSGVLPSRLDRLDNLNNSNLSDLEQGSAEPKFEFEYGDWDELDLQAVTSFGFRKEKLKADVIAQKLKITVWDLQDMLDRFSNFHDSLKTKPSVPFGLFMKCVRRKALEGTDMLAGFKTQVEIEAEEALKDRLAKDKTEIDQFFIEWEQRLSSEQRKEFVGKVLLRPIPEHWDENGQEFRGQLFSYFLSNVWKK
ncbi:MAG: hypothetical protein ACXVCY_04210 [Pseudobdellovibrionaceae bacterium]